MSASGRTCASRTWTRWRTRNRCRRRRRWYRCRSCRPPARNRPSPRRAAMFDVLLLIPLLPLLGSVTFVLLYAFWEGVGVCSYLLIGFWFTRPAAAAAARKAFLVTRIGDAAMFLGILAIWALFTRQQPGGLAPLNSFVFQDVFAAAHNQ